MTASRHCRHMSTVAAALRCQMLCVQIFVDGQLVGVTDRDHTAEVSRGVLHLPASITMHSMFYFVKAPPYMATYQNL
jgi:hypothetical protein